MRKDPTRSRARLIGIVYLLYFLTAVVAEFLLKGLASGGAAATANILAHESTLRLGLAVSLIATACYVAVTALFYILFQPVNRSLSLVAAFFSLLGCALQALGAVFRSAPVAALTDIHSSAVFTIEQSRALFFLKLYTQASNVSLVFFGFYCLAIGYLIWRSVFLPRAFGVLMAAAGFAWLTSLAPPLAASLSPVIQVLGFMAEFSLMLWLVVAGIDVSRWSEQPQQSPALY